MAGEDNDDVGYITEDPHFFPRFDFDDGNDLDDFGFPNLLHPDAPNLVGEANPNQNHFHGHDHGYLPKSPDFFIDMHSDHQTLLNNNEFPQLLHPHEHDQGTLLENANPNQNHLHVHDVAYVPEEPISPLQIHSHPEEHVAGTLIEDADPSVNHFHGHDVGDFPENTYYPSQERITHENHVHGLELDVEVFPKNTYYAQEHITEEPKHHVERNVTGDFAQSQQEGSKSNSKGNETCRWPGWPGHNVFRLLVPMRKVGNVIGPKGEYIKKIMEETKARVKVLSGPHGIPERAVLISAKEEPDRTIPPAVDGLLRVHKQLFSVEHDSADIASSARHSMITRLLVANSQGISLIGKQGKTIKSIQEASGCAIRVIRSEILPVFALQDDSVVEIQGEAARVHKAVELVALYLRKYLVHHSIVGMQRLDVRVNNNMPPPQTWTPPPQGVPAPPDFAPIYQHMNLPDHYVNYYPHTTLPPADTHLYQGSPPAYATDASMRIHPSSVQPQQFVETKDTQHMQIPISYADTVIGASGANISHVVPGKMTFEISRTSSEILAAQQLVQNDMAGAASVSATQDHIDIEGSVSEGDSSYAPPPPSTDFGQ
ncbi:hypothetical protein TanjilG_02335 [Lupinus angustifolius]|uniref:K Homology domain-containing protein n=1 Tax=Lupinus angustifolius TaxID=3871 RepID=A0A4P1QQV9_LUPAN|nr:hypothetical protein TanjilG_02335 [Lupinus angustifolius]